MISLFVAIAVIDITILVYWILSIVDIAKRPDWQWKFAGKDKILWLVLVILVNVVSPFYWYLIRPKLNLVESDAAAGKFGPGHITYSGWEPGPLQNAFQPSVAPPGWYLDPGNSGQLRYFDGMRWSEHLSNAPPT